MKILRDTFNVVAGLSYFSYTLYKATIHETTEEEDISHRLENHETLGDTP